MKHACIKRALGAALLCFPMGALPAATDPIYFPVATTQTEADEYTRYELLAPGSGRFRITYEVTATTAGAPHFYNTIPNGSAAREESAMPKSDAKVTVLKSSFSTVN